MDNIVLVGGILLLQAVILGAVIVLSIHQRSLTHALTAIRQGRERWEEEQERSLSAQVKEVQEAWQAWQAAEAQRIEEQVHRHESLLAQMQVEHEVALLRHVEDTPAPLNKGTPRQLPFANWRPARLGRADLSQRDLSRRYLAKADLSGAQLSGTNFSMADLSEANLAEANLAEATLIGANLAGANLRKAILTDADMLVADLEGAVLTEANLLGVRHFTTEQLASAIYDSTTQLEARVDLHISEMAD